MSSEAVGDASTSTENNSTQQSPSTSSIISNNVESGAAPKKPEAAGDKSFTRYHSLIVSEYNFKVEATESYLKRLQNLRKELNYINDTDWMYETLDKKPQQ